MSDGEGEGSREKGAVDQNTLVYVFLGIFVTASSYGSERTSWNCLRKSASYLITSSALSFFAEDSVGACAGRAVDREDDREFAGSRRRTRARSRTERAPRGARRYFHSGFTSRDGAWGGVR